MNKNRLFVLFYFFLIIPTFMCAVGKSDMTKRMSSITVWSEINVTAPQTNLDGNFMKAIEGIENTLGANLVMVTIPYKDISAKVNLAVQAGGDVPDIVQLNVSKLTFHVDHGTLIDITEYVEASPWYEGIDQSALNTARGLDGRIHAVPFSTRSTLTYSYASVFPDGPPATTADILAAGPGLKEKGMFTITGKASGQYGLKVWWWPLIRTFGGRFADAEGHVAWANDATVKAIEFTREIITRGYAPEVMLSSGFDGEIPFMNGAAGVFNAGTWSYVWLNPLITPSGIRYDHKSASVETAVNAGDLVLSPHISAPGGNPVTPLDNVLWAIPVGSKNVKGAQDFINFMMQTKVNTDVAYAWGGVPTIKEGKNDPRYADNSYWRQVTDFMDKYAEIMEPIAHYDEATLKFTDITTDLVHNPDKDIISVLEQAQDEINAE